MAPLLILLPSLAVAAEVTELPPFLRGDVTVGYDYASEHARLIEDDTLVGQRDIVDSTLRIGGTFSFAPGAQLYFSLPITAGTRVSYTDATTMILDPNGNSGTAVDTALLTEQPELFGKGLDAPWLGVAGTPFSEVLFPDRADRVTWLVDVGYRFKDKSSFWADNGSGQRGGGPGAAAFRFRTAFSTTLGFSEPYVVATLQKTVPLKTLDNTGLEEGSVIRPASEVALRAGTEAVVVSQDATGAKFAIDVYGDLVYQSWADLPSGTYLPSVLDASSGQIATQGETSRFGGGLTLKYRVMEWVQVDVGADLGTFLPYQVEHYYPISTGMGGMTWGVHTNLRFRGRDQPERMPWEAPTASGQIDEEL